MPGVNQGTIVNIEQCSIPEQIKQPLEGRPAAGGLETPLDIVDQILRDDYASVNILVRIENGRAGEPQEASILSTEGVGSKCSIGSH